MKPSILKTALLSLLATGVFVGCGGNSISRAEFKGMRCPENYDPIPLEVPLNEKVQKISWDDLDEGSYEYSGMDVYVVDTRTGFQVQAADVKKENSKEFVGQGVCLRNALKAEPLNIAIELPAVTSVSADGKLLYEIRTLTISYGDVLTIASNSVAEDNVEVPSKVTEKQNFASELYKTIDPLDGREVVEVRVFHQDDRYKKHGIIRVKKNLP